MIYNRPEMRGRNVTLVVILLLLGLFAWRNWAVFSESKPLSLIFTQVQAPFGIVMLVILLVLVVVYFIYTVGMEMTALNEAKRFAREILSTRKLADEAEASRFSDLKKWLEGELAGIKAEQPSGLAGKLDQLMARLDKVEETLRDDFEKAGNTLAAYIGELEDQITGQDRHPPPPPLR